MLYHFTTSYICVLVSIIFYIKLHFVYCIACIMRTLLNAAFEGKERENFEFPLFSKAQMTRSAGKSACRSENIVLNATTLRCPDGEVIGYGAVEVQRIKPLWSAGGRVWYGRSLVIGTAIATAQSSQYSITYRMAHRGTIW